MMPYLLLFFLTLAVATTPPALAGEAVLTWDPPLTNEDGTPLTNLGGYRLHYGLASGAYNTSIDVGNVVTYTVSGLPEKTTYYFAVIAYNNYDLESQYSNEVTKLIPDRTPPALMEVSAGNLSETGATITWKTSEPATSQIEYGTRSDYGSITPEDTVLQTDHAVTLTSLSSDTTYHFRVISMDDAGNQTTTVEDVFVTLRHISVERPFAISDLRVRPGESTRNSLWLDWTATGADEDRGTASRYDLRISASKIIEDGAALNPGEIHFSDATPITGVPAPTLAGTPQALQISNLETNTVYFFAIVAADEKGTTSPLSNVINGDFVPPIPVTAVRQGFTMISFPLIPVTSDVQALLRPISDAPVELTWWSSSGLTSESGSFIKENTVVPGYGYFLKAATADAVLGIAGIAVTDTHRAIPLQPGWNLIGNPYPREVLLKDTQVRNIETGEGKTFEGAVTAGWTGNALYDFDGSIYKFYSYTDAALKLWHGYWLFVPSDTTPYELIVPKP